MKKILFLLIIILLLAADVFAYTTPLELAKGEGNAEDAAKLIKHNIHYYKAPNQDCYWQKSEDTLRSGTGDCKDYAVLFYDTIKCYGYEAYIYIIDWKMTGHAVCVFKNRRGYWQVFDTAGLHDQWLCDIGQLIKYTYLGCGNYYKEISLQHS
jgi:hypothetical protein